MNDRRYQWILYTIVTVIAITITIQIYWNYKNYQTNKQQLINDVQVSLDKAVDDYYTSLAHKTTFTFAFSDSISPKAIIREKNHKQLIKKTIDTTYYDFKILDSIKVDTIKSISIFKKNHIDSILNCDLSMFQSNAKDSLEVNLKHLNFANDSILFEEIGFLTSKVMLSLKQDALDIKAIDSLVKTEFKRKNIDLDSKLTFYENTIHKVLSKNLDSITTHNKPKTHYTLNTTSKSKFLPKNSILKIEFTDETATVLKRSLIGILISTLLVLTVIGCLFYLLRIIKHQKQLAEVKNDLISNITHEFKTPIATIGVALESINNFNGIDDKEKTKKYINMSSEQLGKLNVMVEKLLETATLDSDNLDLKKESVNVISLLSELTRKYKIQYSEKEFNTSFKVKSLEANVDLFHFENALNNILDNAVKYGGHIISIDLTPREDMFDILISDNGNKLSKENKDRIFEKFYRVPKGNTHDVKGFGIGLYYTKTIIEKHGGVISLDLNRNMTSFKLSLPNV